MEHETKNEDHQTREDEFVNLWCTWMSEIHTKLEKMGSTSSLTWHGEEEARARSVCWLGLGEEEGGRFIVGSLVPASGSSRYKI